LIHAGVETIRVGVAGARAFEIIEGTLFCSHEETLAVLLRAVFDDAIVIDGLRREVRTVLAGTRHIIVEIALRRRREYVEAGVDANTVLKTGELAVAKSGVRCVRTIHPHGAATSLLRETEIEFVATLPGGASGVVLAIEVYAIGGAVFVFVYAVTAVGFRAGCGIRVLWKTSAVEEVGVAFGLRDARLTGTGGNEALGKAGADTARIIVAIAHSARPT